MKRAVAAFPIPDITPGTPSTGAPVFMMVRPEELLVDDDYQRRLSESSIKLIKRIVADWDWRKFKAPNVAMTEEGALVLDGQHTATAAACHPDIVEIPVLVVDAPDKQAQAEAFVGINTNRLGITSAQIHQAKFAAGDETALRIDRVCARAGVKLLRLTAGRGIYNPGESVAVSAIGTLIEKMGEGPAVETLRILTRGQIGPIQAVHIRALQHLLTNDEFADLDRDDLARVITAEALVQAERDAKAFASTHSLPLWRALAAVWFKSARKSKRRPVDSRPDSTSPISARSPAQPTEPIEEKDGDSARGHQPRIETVQRRAARDLKDIRIAPPDEVEQDELAPIEGVTLQLGAIDDMPDYRPAGAKQEARSPAVMRPDPRPDRMGWLSGPLQKRCTSCSAVYIGGLKSVHCADCAYGMAGTA